MKAQSASAKRIVHATDAPYLPVSTEHGLLAKQSIPRALDGFLLRFCPYQPARPI